MADDQDTDFEPRARPPSRPEPPRPQREQVTPGRSISVDINPRQLRVTPGITESATVSIRYHGSVIGELSLRLSGEPATWTRVVPDVLNVYPDTEVEATLRLDPPRASWLAAGLMELALEVSSSADAAATTVLRRSVEIAPFDELSAAAAGSTNLSDPREAVLPIKVRNLGNRLALVGLRAADPGALEFALSAASVPLQAGEETTVWVTARPRQTITAGPPRLHPFTVYVSSDRTPAVAIDGRYEQLPVPPPAPAPPPQAPPPGAVPPAWRAPTPAALQPKKRRSRLLPGLLVIALLVAGGAAAAYVLKLWPPNPNGDGQTDRPTGETSKPSISPTEPPDGGVDIAGTWVAGDIRPGSGQQFDGTLVLGDLNVTGGGTATWSVELFGQPFYSVGCEGGYDDSSSTISAKSGFVQEGDTDEISKALSANYCGWDIDAASGQLFEVTLNNDFPVSLTLYLGGAELEWKKGL